MRIISIAILYILGFTAFNNLTICGNNINTKKIKENYTFVSFPEDSLKPIPKGITARKVIDSYIKAMGGKRRYKKVKQLTIYMEARLGNTNLQVVKYKKSPNKYAKIMKTGDVVFEKVVYNGRLCKMYNRLGNKTIKGVELREIKAEGAISPAYKYTRSGYKYNLLGVAYINDTIYAYKMEFTSPAKKVFYEYFDITTGLLIKRIETIERTNGTDTVTTYFNKYYRVKKLRFPYEVVTNFGEEALTMRVTAINQRKRISKKVFILE